MSVMEPEQGQTIIREEGIDVGIDAEKTGIYTVETRKRIDTTLRLSHIDAGTVLPFMDGMTVLQELGRGGMGTVFLAQQHRTNALFAVKVINAQGDNNNVKSDSESAARQRREFEGAVRARREFEIVKNAYEKGVHCVPEPHAYEILKNNEDERHCIITEFIPGRDAASIIQAKGPLSIREAFWFATKTSEGLSAIHEAGMVHRDIKPSNIMIGGENDVTIMDFGLVRDTNEKTITQDHTFLGTLPYIAPEVFINGGDSNSAPCDVYALGISFYEALVGKKPLELKNPIDYFTFWRSDELKLIIKKGDCPIANDPKEQEFVDGLFNLIVEMTHPNPEKRFKMEEVTTALSAMGKLPNTPASKIALPPIDYTTKQHSPETVREYMSDAATTVMWGNKPAALKGFNPERTAEFTHISAKAIEARTAATRSKIAKWTLVSAVSIGGVLAYFNKEVEPQITAAQSLVPIVTTPNLIEEPKPTNIAFEYDRDESLQSVAININMPKSEKSPEYRETITLNTAEALIIGYDNNSDETEDENFENCYTVLCSPDQMIAIQKMFFKDSDPKSNKIEFAKFADNEIAYIFPQKKGRNIVYFRKLGIAISDDTSVQTFTNEANDTSIQTFTNEQIEEGLLSDKGVIEFLSGIKKTHMVRDFDPDFLEKEKLNQDYGERLAIQGMLKQIAQLVEKFPIETITRVSATSSQ